MSDSPATPELRRRRWKRWAVVFVLVLGLTLFAWPRLTEDRRLRNARSVKLGQSKEQVQAIMGPETTHYIWMGKTGLLYGAAAQVRLTTSALLQQAGLQEHKIPQFDDFPVNIRFDANGRVDRIKRGTEIIEAP